jgi:purine-binding chemotaxis protein CheW
MSNYLEFYLDRQRYGLNISSIHRVIRAVEITPVPNESSQILGVINMHQKILPVIDLRKKLGLPAKPLAITDEMIITNLDDKLAVILVDSVAGIEEHHETHLTPLPDKPNEIIQMIFQSNNELIFVCDLAKLMEEVSIYDTV